MKSRSNPSFFRRLQRALRRRLQLGGRSQRSPLEPIEGYRRWAASYDAPPTVFQQLEAEVRSEWLGQPWQQEATRILDLGAGKGRVSRELGGESDRWCAALDLTLAMLVAGARERSPVTVLPAVVGDAIALPFRSRSFDLVVAALVFGHVSDLRRAFAEAGRVLRPGGSLVVTDFHPAATERGWTRTFEDSRTGLTESVESHRHSLGSYLESLEQAGMTLVDRAEPRWNDRTVVLALRGRLDRAVSS